MKYHTIRNVRVDWATLKEPDTKYAKPYWRIDLKLSKEEANNAFKDLREAAKTAVLNRMEKAKSNPQELLLLNELIKDDAAMFRAIFTVSGSGYRLRAKRDASTGNPPPKLVDKEQQPLNENTFIAKGDKVSVIVTCYAYTLGGRAAGVSCQLHAVQLLEKSEFAQKVNVIDWGTSHE